MRKLSREEFGEAATLQGPPPTEYFAFGLSIRSDIPLPELSPSELTGRDADLSIRLEPCGRPLPPEASGVVIDLDPDGGHYLAWPGVAAFRFHGPARIDVEPYPGISAELLAFPLLGPVFGLMLHMRGALVLHASGVAIGGRSAVFVGDKMAGKSTTAGAFVEAGHRLLTDDLLAIDLVDPLVPRILPAFAQLKLSEESSAAIDLGDAEALPLAHASLPKRQFRLGGDSPTGRCGPTISSSCNAAARRRWSSRSKASMRLAPSCASPTSRASGARCWRERRRPSIYNAAAGSPVPRRCRGSMCRWASIGSTKRWPSSTPCSASVEMQGAVRIGGRR
ncbi:hypothetical protein ACFSTI_29590 [Rhizorhabdus histidinilytica]